MPRRKKKCDKEGSVPKFTKEEYAKHYFIPKRVEVPSIQDLFNKLPHPAKALISTWLLVFGFTKISEVKLDAVAKGFRRLAVLHHPDRGGSQETFKALSSVRDHLVTLCTLAGV